MKVKLQRIIESFQIGSLPRFAGGAGLPIKTAFRVKAVWKQAQEVIQNFEKERLELCKQLGTLNMETGAYDFATAEIRAQFQREYDDLISVEIEINAEQFTAKDFQPRAITSGPFLSANDLCALDWLIYDETEVAEDWPNEVAAKA